MRELKGCKWLLAILIICCVLLLVEGGTDRANSKKNSNKKENTNPAKVNSRQSSPVVERVDVSGDERKVLKLRMRTKTKIGESNKSKFTKATPKQYEEATKLMLPPKVPPGPRRSIQVRGGKIHVDNQGEFTSASNVRVVNHQVQLTGQRKPGTSSTVGENQIPVAYIDKKLPSGEYAVFHGLQRSMKSVMDAKDPKEGRVAVWEVGERSPPAS